jgi:phospholipid/cholesterol/gamma-HCH transport system substrate-binding protein
VLGVFTIILSRENIFSKNYYVNVHFANVLGLREGDNVYVRGVSVGKVKSLAVQTNGVFVVANLEIPVSLHEDYKVEILPSSVLGGRYLSLYEGSEASPSIPSDTVLKGLQPIDLIDEASEAVLMIRRTLDEGKVLENLEVTMQQIREVSTRLNSGEGTLGKLMTDDTIYNDIQSVAADLKVVGHKLAAGEGTLGRLLMDDQVYNDIQTVASDLKTISGRLARGEGTLGKLLSSDDQLYTDLADTASSLNEITAKIREGEGTLGKIVQDDALYEDLKKTLHEARAMLDDIRETSPITTFTSIFFGAF